MKIGVNLINKELAICWLSSPDGQSYFSKVYISETEKIDIEGLKKKAEPLEIIKHKILPVKEAFDNFYIPIFKRNLRVYTTLVVNPTEGIEESFVFLMPDSDDIKAASIKEFDPNAEYCESEITSAIIELLKQKLSLTQWSIGI